MVSLNSLRIFHGIEGLKALIDSIPFIRTPQITGLPLMAINLLKFLKEANWLIKAYSTKITF